MTLKGEKNLISLREAAKITGYSADYIGQLIRAGKLPGKQVYSNVAWMTTAEAILEYKNRGSKENSEPGFAEKLKNSQRKITLELNILRLFFKTFKSSLPILIIMVISFLLLGFFIFYSIFSWNDNQVNTEINNNQSEEVLLF